MHKFEIGNRIIYLTYLQKSGKMASHLIIDINKHGYVCKNPHYAGETHNIPFELEKDFITNKDLVELYPELIISLKGINGPTSLEEILEY